MLGARAPASEGATTGDRKQQTLRQVQYLAYYERCLSSKQRVLCLQGWQMAERSQGPADLREMPGARRVVGPVALLNNCLVMCSHEPASSNNSVCCASASARCAVLLDTCVLQMHCTVAMRVLNTPAAAHRVPHPWGLLHHQSSNWCTHHVLLVRSARQGHVVQHEERWSLRSCWQE